MSIDPLQSLLNSIRVRVEYQTKALELPERKLRERTMTMTLELVPVREVI